MELKLILIPVCFIVVVQGEMPNGPPPNEPQRNESQRNGTSRNTLQRNDTSSNRRQGPPSGIDSLFPKECRKVPKTDMKDCCKIFPDIEIEKAKSCWGNISFNSSKSINGTKFHNNKANNSSFSTNSSSSSTTNGTKNHKFNRNNSSKPFGFMQGFCHSSDCMLTNLGYLKNGSFDAENAKVAIEAMKKDSAWTKELTDKIVEGCVERAQENMEEWKGPKCQEQTLRNMVIGHCIRREFYFQCPVLDTKDKCEEVYKYGKACQWFPKPNTGRGNFTLNRKAKKSGNETEANLRIDI